jgi:hypothetical protein
MWLGFERETLAGRRMARMRGIGVGPWLTCDPRPGGLTREAESKPDGQPGPASTEILRRDEVLILAVELQENGCVKHLPLRLRTIYVRT